MFDESILLVENEESLSLRKVGLWRSWERASMAWKRSSVRSRPGPPKIQMLTDSLLSSLVSDFE